MESIFYSSEVKRSEQEFQKAEEINRKLKSGELERVVHQLQNTSSQMVNILETEEAPSNAMGQTFVSEME